jgi:hypothetical protein
MFPPRSAFISISMSEDRICFRRRFKRFAAGFGAPLLAIVATAASAGEFDPSDEPRSYCASRDRDVDAPGGCARISGYIAAGADLADERIGGRSPLFSPPAEPEILTGLGGRSRPSLEPLSRPDRFFLHPGQADWAR